MCDGNFFTGPALGSSFHGCPQAGGGGLGRADSGLLRRRWVSLPPCAGGQQRLPKGGQPTSCWSRAASPRRVTVKMKGENAYAALQPSGYSSYHYCCRGCCYHHCSEPVRGQSGGEEKLGLRIFCPITCTRGQRPEGGTVTAWADGQFTGGAHLVTLTPS